MSADTFDVKTLAEANDVGKRLADPGDKILFKKGTTTLGENYVQPERSSLMLYEGITYGGYGEGAKPKIVCHKRVLRCAWPVEPFAEIDGLDISGGRVVVSALHPLMVRRSALHDAKWGLPGEANNVIAEDNDFYNLQMAVSFTDPDAKLERYGWRVAYNRIHDIFKQPGETGDCYAIGGTNINDSDFIHNRLWRCASDGFEIMSWVEGVKMDNVTIEYNLIRDIGVYAIVFGGGWFGKIHNDKIRFNGISRAWIVGIKLNGAGNMDNECTANSFWQCKENIRETHFNAWKVAA